MYELEADNRSYLAIATTWNDRTLYYGPFPNTRELIEFMANEMIQELVADDAINGFTIQYMNKVVPPWNFNEVASVKIS